MTFTMYGTTQHSNLNARARSMRQVPAQGEAELWQLLRSRRFHGLKFRRQHQIDGYIVDFYCHERRWVIEVDGTVHEDKLQRAVDHDRDIYLRSLGLAITRLQADQVVALGANMLENIEVPQANRPGVWSACHPEGGREVGKPTKVPGAPLTSDVA